MSKLTVLSVAHFCTDITCATFRAAFYPHSTHINKQILSTIDYVSGKTRILFPVFNNSCIRELVSSRKL